MLRRNQKGFTLIEIVIAVAIAGLVVAAAAGAIVQLVQSADTTAHMVAVRQVQQAGYWLSTDALQAQNVSANTPTASGSRDFPLTLTLSGHNISYTLEPTDDLQELQRSDGTANMTVARYLTDMTTCSWNATAGLLTFTVEASVMGARGAETETRTYEVRPRAYGV
jgi:prepilin-type N-terminal cleavage/methylation domain-containing protein